jgi:hypothetical protein
MRHVWVLCLLSLLARNDSRIIAQLEKETKDLQEQLQSQRQADDWNLQSICAAAAKAYFDERWAPGRNKDTIRLDYINHYNKPLGKCFVLVEYNYRMGREGICLGLRA